MNWDVMIKVIIGATLVNNFILARFLGLCPFINTSDNTSKAFGMGMAVTFVMTLASLVTYLLYHYVLRPDAMLLAWCLGPKSPITREGLEAVLRTSSYILVIASLVQLVEMFMRKVIPALYRALGIFLPLITTNCAVLGVTLLNTTDAPDRSLVNLPTVVLQGFFAGVGFTLAMLLMSGIRESIDRLPVPAPFKGVPIAFVCTGLMALAFLGFSGMG